MYCRIFLWISACRRNGGRAERRTAIQRGHGYHDGGRRRARWEEGSDQGRCRRARDLLNRDAVAPSRLRQARLQKQV
jgi:hypothetical protein